jgi:hypothetical protein
MTNIEQVLASKRKWREIERKYNSRALRAVHNSLLEKQSPTPSPRIVLESIVFVIFLIIGFIIISCNPVHAYTDKEAVIAIIGEAENQGYKGMLAVACAIRNRGTLKGVYGLNSKRAIRVFKTDRKVRIMAIKAWNESMLKDITCGATHWENIKAFGKPWWASKCVVTLRHKDHVFMREL